MREKLSKAQWAKKAAEAHTNLTMFHAIISLAESGGFYGCPRELTPIIAAAKRGASRQLHIYDEALEAATCP